MRLPAFIREKSGLASFALLATATSGFGQTFFFSVFGTGIRGTCGLANSAYGLLYGLATLLSAAMLLRLGSLVDRWALAPVTVLSVGLLAAGCLTIGLASNWGWLIPGFLMARLGGKPCCLI